MEQKRFSLISGTEEGIRWAGIMRVRRNGKISFPDLYVQDVQTWQQDFRENNRKLVQQKERAYYAKNLDRERRRRRESTLFRNATKYSMGICWECGEINWEFLENHHPDKEKLPDFTVTMCANCHTRLHYYLGNGLRKNG